MIACHHHHVEAVGNVEDPVELWKRIMEVGYQEESHEKPVRGGWRKPDTRLSLNRSAKAALLRQGLGTP